MPAGIRDLIGRRRIFLAGVTLFTLASAACGLAAGQATLIIPRFIQGLGGAAATSAIVAIIATEFREPRERAKAMSVYTFVISGGGSLGLIAGGAITQSLDWHWIFFINLPIGIATVLLGRRWIIENPGLGIGRDIDVLGSVLVTVAMVLGPTRSSPPPPTVGAPPTRSGWAAARWRCWRRSWRWRRGCATRSCRCASSRFPGLAGSSVVRGLLITGMYATFFIGVLYLERLLHFGVLQTGLAFLPQTLVLAAMSLGPTATLVNR